MGERPGELDYDSLDDAGEPLTPPDEYLTRGAATEPAYYGLTTAPPEYTATANTVPNATTGDEATMASARQNPEGQNPDQIRHDIERTRQHMSSTVNAIQDKLSPQHLVHQATSAVHDATIGRAEQVMNDVSDTVQNAGSTILDTIRENPIPAVLAAAGLGWLTYKVIANAQANNQYNATYRGYGPTYRQGYGYRGVNNYATGYNRSSPTYQDYGQYQGQSAMSQAANAVQNAAGNVTDKVQDMAGNVADTVQNAAGNVADTAQQWASQAQDQAQQLGYQAEWQMRRAKNWLEQTWESNPLAVGVAALAAGAIIGGLLPETQMEDRLMGDTRDNLFERAEGVAQGAVQKAQSAAEQALHQVKQDVVSQQQPASQTKSPAPTQARNQAQPSGATKTAGTTSSQTGSQATNQASQPSTSSKSATSSTSGNSQTTSSASKQTPPPPTTGDTSSQTTSSPR